MKYKLTKMRCFPVVGLVAIAVIIEGTTLPCKFDEDADYGAIDLSGLQRNLNDEKNSDGQGIESYYSTKSTFYSGQSYAFNICGDLSSWRSSTSASVVLQNSNIVSTKIDATYPYGYWSSKNLKGWAGKADRLSATSVRYELHSISNGVEPKTIFNLECATSCPEGFSPYWDTNGVCNITIKDEEAHEVTIALTTSAMCSTPSPSATVVNAIVTTMFVLGALVIIYFIAGIIYNYKQGLKGTDLVPHNHIWFALPGLVFDGCVFTKDKIMGFRQRTSSSWGVDQYELLGAQDFVASDNDTQSQA